MSLSRLIKPLLLSGALLFSAFASRAQAEDLRIGFIAPMTGLFAQVGKDMVDGFQMYLDEHGNKLGGMDVKFILEDDQAKPDLGVTKAKKLVLNDQVQMFIGGVLASTGYALAPVSTEMKTVYIASIPAADDLTQRQADKFPYLIRTGWSSSQPAQPMGQWACDQGYKKIVAVGADYAFGYEQVGGFQKTFEDCGGKIVAARAMTNSPCPSCRRWRWETPFQAQRRSPAAGEAQVWSASSRARSRAAQAREWRS